MELPAGLYEVVVTETLHSALSALDGDLVRRDALRSAEAADRFAQLVARQVERALEAVPDADRVALGVALTRRLLEVLGTAVPK
jgi:hypothetical protein